jgi:hypothetical protein
MLSGDGGAEAMYDGDDGVVSPYQIAALPDTTSYNRAHSPQDNVRCLWCSPENTRQHSETKVL